MAGYKTNLPFNADNKAKKLTQKMKVLCDLSLFFNIQLSNSRTIRYQREQTRLRGEKLRDVLSEDDILGNKSVEYFQEKWDELVEKYNY